MLKTTTKTATDKNNRFLVLIASIISMLNLIFVRFLFDGCCFYFDIQNEFAFQGCLTI